MEAGTRKQREVPGPRGLPLLGMGPAVRRDLLGTFTRLVAEYGDVVRLNMPGALDGYLVADPDLTRTILLETERGYVKPEPILTRLSTFLGQGLLTSGGDLWKRQRRLASPAFHRVELFRVGPLIEEVLGRRLERWGTVADRGGSLDVLQEMTGLAMEVLPRFLFSSELNAHEEQVAKSLTVFERYFHAITTAPLFIPPRAPTPGNLRLERHRRRMHALLGGLIEARRRMPPERRPKDLLARLLDAVDESGAPLSDALLRDELLTLLIAGQDTTANALAFTLHLLSQAPEHARRIEQELDEALGGARPTLEDLPKLQRVRRAFEESLRLYPTAHFLPRKNLADLEYKGCLIPAGSTLYISTYALHRNPRYWEDPDGFDPERFSPERLQRRHPHAYLPFGGGARMCIGAQLTMMQGPLMLAMMLQRFRLHGVPGRPFTLAPRLTLTAVPGIEMYVRRR